MHDKRKAAELERLRERRKRLRLPTQPSDSAAEEQEDEEEHDGDYVPLGRGSGHDDGAAGDDDNVVAPVGEVTRAKSRRNLYDALRRNL